MVKVVAYIRCSSHAKFANVRFRLTDVNVDITHTSEITVNPNLFDKKTQGYSIKSNVPDKVKFEFARTIFSRKELLLEIYHSATGYNKFSSKWFNQKVLGRLSEISCHEPDDIPTSNTKHQSGNGILTEKDHLLIDTFADFLQKYNISEVRRKNYKVIFRSLQRYELYACHGKKSKKIYLSEFNTDKLSHLEYFFQNEYDLAKTYSKLYSSIPENRMPKPRGRNTISDMMTKIRTFFIWCYKNQLILSNPFVNYKIKSCVYGSPIYISIDELNTIYSTDLSARPALAIQRDIFVFHSMVGCRVSDLLKLTWQNVIGETITYIPNKSKHIRSNAIIVPLNDTSREILERYRESQKLLPFISEQKYNKSIKEVFRLAGITRKVIILNSLTGKEELVPINTIASSHMCRRNMVGNLYHFVQDTAVIGSMTGHSPNSRAFSRYRNIDNQVKKSAIDNLKLLSQ
jgi:integrase